MSNTGLHRVSRTRVIQNFYLVWLIEHIDETNDDFYNLIHNLQPFINDVNTFTDVDECVDFITDIKDEKVFLIVSEAFTDNIVSICADISQIKYIHIFSENESLFMRLKKLSFKVKSASKDMTSIGEIVRETGERSSNNAMTITFIKPTSACSKYNLDTLDCSFMYTQILKEILLTIDFSYYQFEAFSNYCREKFVGDESTLIQIEKFAKEYHYHRPIWWYTSATFLYSMLNKALRLMDVNTLLRIGFFLSDLHKDIAALHSEQDHSNSFVAYRGQGLSHADFDHLRTTQGGLLAFNSFLSVSSDHAVAYSFADSNRDDPDLVGVLFRITINSSTASTPFANIKSLSHFQEEEELLFSMNSIFRIGQITSLDGSSRLWQVELTLTSDDDPQLRDLSENIRETTCSGSSGWNRLCLLLIELGHYDETVELCRLLLRGATRLEEKSYLLDLLGCAKNGQGLYEQAIQCCERAVEIQEGVCPVNHRSIASYLFNIGHVYVNMGEYSKALEYYHQSLNMRETISATDSDFAFLFNNIGFVYNQMGDYFKARQYYKKALNIQEKILPQHHPHLASSYNNIGYTHNNMGEYAEALKFYQRALDIYEKSLPTNHHLFVTSYNNIGAVFAKESRYPEAFQYYQKALDICQKNLSANHSNLAVTYNNTGLAHAKLCNYSQAIHFYHMTLESARKILPRNHPVLATYYNNIGTVYEDMGQHPKSLSYHEKALEICQKSNAVNRPLMANIYNNIAAVYSEMSESSKALDYYLKALEIYKKSLREDHPDLISCYNNIGLLYADRGQYPQALETLKKTLHKNNPSLAASCNNIGGVYRCMGEHSLALAFFTKAIEILQSLPLNRALLATSYNNIGLVYDFMEDYSRALSYYEAALDIRLEILLSNHPHLAVSYRNIAIIYCRNQNYAKALEYFERALSIKKLSLQPNDPAVKEIEECIEIARKNL